MIEIKNSTFLERYGSWALVLGASEGVGSAFAETLAAQGLNVVLVSRRQGPLDEVASKVRAAHSVEARVIAMDLSLHDAMQTLCAKVDDLEIGFLVNCAGGDTGNEHFLDRDLASEEAMLFRNCTLLMRVCHHFGGKMVARGRGGIVNLSSGAAVAGTAGLATYAGTKAFDLLFSEALWGELKPQGVDVICLMLADTDTPTLRRQMMMRGKISSLNDAPKGATPAHVVAEEALRYLGKGPTRVISRKLRIGSRIMGVLGRNRAVAIMTIAANKIMGDKKGIAG
ncbi:MAG: short-subunit dehydrogenase [Paracoccaceae bacterium]|jgi:short-subunit dehydrogenase